MAGTEPAPPGPNPPAEPAAVGQVEDTWANRFTLVVAGIGYLAIIAALVAFIFVHQDANLVTVIVGILGGAAAAGHSFFYRGRVELPGLRRQHPTQPTGGNVVPPVVVPVETERGPAVPVVPLPPEERRLRPVPSNPPDERNP